MMVWGVRLSRAEAEVTARRRRMNDAMNKRCQPRSSKGAKEEKEEG